MLKIQNYYSLDSTQKLIQIGPIYIDERNITMIEKIFGPEKNCKIPASMAFVYSEYERLGLWAIHLSTGITFAVEEEVAKRILEGTGSTFDKNMFG